MSTTSKVTLIVSCIASAGIISYVWLKQQYDRQELRAGVYKDVERQRRRQENLEMLEQQIRLTNQLRDEMEAKEKT